MTPAGLDRYLSESMNGIMQTLEVSLRACMGAYRVAVLTNLYEVSMRGGSESSSLPYAASDFPCLRVRC